MTQAARSDRQRALDAVAARDRHDRLDGQDIGALGQAGQVGALLLLGDGDRVQVQAGRCQQLRGDLCRGDAAQAVKMGLGKGQAITLGNGDPRPVMPGHRVGERPVEVKDETLPHEPRGTLRRRGGEVKTRR
jgi:hypothetical protein